MTWYFRTSLLGISLRELHVDVGRVDTGQVYHSECSELDLEGGDGGVVVPRPWGGRNKRSRISTIVGRRSSHGVWSR